ncbi:MAG: hypothetical protein PHU25_20035 [Deltaproteobacteria bacterium]|nr:hypothetical protein [Deltaproteobacteria bacterium]
MSIKRTKQRSGTSARRAANADFFGFDKPKDPEKTWGEHMAERNEEVFVPYAITSRFASGALISHPTFGKGIVTAVDGARIVVLFETGTKKLGHTPG